ncbi:agamous-like MADS-box protein AGL80 [Andrographis paniculata]|uniref:agamous-like MADS-box protein AGL80 n=1 Tax=Andrographis paniculata TaxID=175694 RepID=UPI0021E99088|nr:agamous-like MADS-box protein AGL80 [Andrographis paniculata]
MTRKRIRHEKLLNENKRNSVLSKRSEGLAKKAEQLQILCGVDIAIIGHRQGGEGNVILWPSPEAVEERVNKFMEFPELERKKKMVTHESYLEQTLNTERDNIAKLQKVMAVKEGHQLLAQKPLDMMQITELSMVEDMAMDMIKKLKKRADEIGHPMGTTSGLVEGGGELL